MIVRLDVDGASVLEPDDCRRLHVMTTPTVSDVTAALRAAGIGRLGANGDALLDVEELRRRAHAVATAPDWADSWTAMIGYATAKGWLTPDGRHLVAHVEQG